MDATLLMVGNWDSGVGYAWWLMESYWKALAEANKGRSILAYPKITTIPEAVSGIETVEVDFTHGGSLSEQIAFIRANRIDTIYLTDQQTCHWSYLYWREAGVKRIIVHSHTPGLRTAPTGLRRLLKAAIARLPWINADLCIGATEFVQRRFIDVNCIPSHKTAAAPNGLPPINVTPVDARELFGIPADRLILVSTGRLAAIKNIPFALLCVAHLPRLHYLHIGDGPDLEALQSLAAQLGITDRVTWAGRRSDVNAILPTCDIAIQPSRGEVGYSLSILEYMRAGLPVLVPLNPSVHGATRHGDDGLIYPEDDISGAVQHLGLLIGDKDRRQGMGAAGRQRVLADFSLTNTHRALLQAVIR